jgi:hypothetical protein
MNRKVQEQLMALQQRLEVVSISPEHKSGEAPSTSQIEEARATTSYFSEMTTGRKVLNISPDVIEFPIPEMQEQVQ